MPRYDNPFQSGYPTNPAFAAIGQSLSRALFGDPAARQEQELQQARLEQIEQSTRADSALADSRNLPMKARGNIAEIFSRLIPQTTPAPPAPGGLIPLAPGAGGDAIQVPPGFEGVAAAIAEALPAETGGQAPPVAASGMGNPGAASPAEPEPRRVDSGTLAELIGAFAQGDQLAQADDMVRLFTSQTGGDELARRGMVGAGGTPGANFALTPERADDIRSQGYDADMDRTMVRDRTTRRGQNMGSSDRRYNVDVGSADRRRDQDIDSGDRRRGQDISADTARGTGQSRGERNNNAGNLEDGRFARSQPGYVGNDGRFARFDTPENGFRAQETLLRRNYGGRSVRQVILRYAPPGENSTASVDNYVNHVARRLGISPDQVVQDGQIGEMAAAMREFETGNYGRPTRAGGRSGGQGRAPRAVSRSAIRTIEEEIARRPNAGALASRTREGLRRMAIQNFQTSGNPVEAVEQAIQTLTTRGQARRAGGRRIAASGQVGRSGGSAAPAPAPAGPTLRFDANGRRIG